MLFVVILLTLVMLRVLWPRWRGGRGRIGGLPGASPSPPVQGWSHSDQPAINSVQGDLFPGTSHRAGAGPGDRPRRGAGNSTIEAHDPGFDKGDLPRSQVQRTFFIVQEAWTARYPDMSRQVMADGLWQQHRFQIESYRSGDKRNVLDGLTVESLTIIAVHTDANYDTITVRILACSADYDVDDF